MEKIENIRKEIDKVDLEILNLLKQRFELTAQIWEIKKQSNIPFLQKSRWEELLAKVVEEASNLWLDEEMIKITWNSIHMSSLKNQWK